MSKIDNFKQAAYDMFGVGSTVDSAAQGDSDSEVTEPAPPAEPVVSGELAAAARHQTITAPSGAPYVLVPATYLAPGTVMEGTLRSKGDVEIAGTFKGDIITEGDVILHTNIEGNVTSNNLSLADCSVTGDCKVTTTMRIDSSSSVKGDISAAELVCSGSIVGNIVVRGNATFDSTAIVDSNLTTGSIVIERGAKISGQLNMKG